MLAFAGWLVHKEQALPDAKARINTALRFAGFVLTLLTSCGLATLHWDGSQFPNTAGGALKNLDRAVTGGAGHGSAGGSEWTKCASVQSVAGV